MKNTNSDKGNLELGEAQLFELIRQAGNEARIRKKKAMERHRERLRDAVKEGVLHRRDSSSI